MEREEKKEVGKGMRRPEGREGRKEVKKRERYMGTRSGRERGTDEEGEIYGERRWEREGGQKDLEWFASYLKNRTQSVKVSGFQSEK